MRITTLALLGLGLSLAACRGSDNNDGGDDDPGPTPDAPVNPDGQVPTELRVQDIQDASMAEGTAVTLKGVVITAIDTFGSRTGDFWVQDPDGGPFSGIKIFGAPVEQLANLVPGDIIDIAGAQKDEFAINGDTSGRAVTELKPAATGTMTLTKKGTGPLPAPMTVDATAIAAMDKAAREAEWEKWEGVLITVVNARQIAALRRFGDMAADQSEFRITGIARVQSSLVELPASNAFGVCYDRITGIGDYAFNDLVIPRSADDLRDGGTGCRPFATSVVAAQSGVNPELAALTNVFVTARSRDGKSIWVADALEGAVNNGVFVFTNAALPATFAIGAKVSVQGLVEEFDTAAAGQQPVGDKVTEITGGTPTVVEAPGATLPSPAVVSAATLSDLGAPGEAYEGVLVQATTMKVTAVLTNGKVELTANGGTKLIMDDDSFTPTDAPTVGTCYASVTGVMHVQLVDNIRTINPRQASDLAVGAGCE